jgi:GNAT superfamily N-acetyltransferase
MQVNEAFRVRAMNQGDIPSAMDLCYSEGWNQTEKDWRLLLDNPANICIVIEAGKRIIGTSTALNHSDKVAWIGMVLIDKEFRGRGAGRLIFDHLLKKLEHFDSVKLDATPAGYPVYFKSGFTDELTIYRMTTSSCRDLSRADFCADVENITVENISEIIKYDENIFGVNRKYVLETLLKNYPEKAFLIKRNNKICGYVMGRDGTRFNYIGPAFAQTSDDARALVGKALAPMNNKPVALDILEDKNELTEWLQLAGFEIQRSFVRMFLKSNSYCGAVKNQFLISGPELG